MTILKEKVTMPKMRTLADPTVMLTARDVADRLGLSVSTIGRALADDPRISASTKVRVLAAAEAIGYVANAPARMMRGGASKLVGLVLPDIRNDFYATIAQALSQCCDREGYRLALSITDDDRDVEARHVKELVGARVAGIIVVPTASPRRETITMLSGLPRVQLLRDLPILRCDWFGIDDEHCLQTGTRHLLELGHRRIAYIGGREALPTGSARVRGFRRALAAAGVDPASTIEELGATTAAFGIEASLRLLSAPTPPTAMITGSVLVTLGVLEVLRAQNIAVPGQISIVGFGDPPWFKWWGDGLTTLHMPVEELATACGLWFLNRLRTKQESPRPHASITPASLIVRGTTAPCAKASVPIGDKLATNPRRAYGRGRRSSVTSPA